MPLKINMTNFENAIRQVRVVSKKEGAQILNENVLKVVIGAKGVQGLVHLHPKATEARIEADMKQEVSAVQSRSGEWPGSHTIPRLLALASLKAKERGVKKHGFHDPAYNAEISKYAAAMLKARKSSRAYIVAGWLFAARMLKQRIPGLTGLTRLEPRNMPKPYLDGTAAKSFAIAATPNSLVCGLFNTSRGAENFTGIVQTAVDNATEDMRQYFYTKLGAAYARAINNGTVI